VKRSRSGTPPQAPGGSPLGASAGISTAWPRLLARLRACRNPPKPGQAHSGRRSAPAPRYDVIKKAA
jgi:hypothetical protein